MSTSGSPSRRKDSRRETTIGNTSPQQVRPVRESLRRGAVHIKVMAEKDVWLSIQIAFLGEEPTPEQIAIFGEVTAAKFRRVREGVATAIGYAQKHGVKIAFGTDLFGPRLPEITKEFTYRQEYFSNVEILRQATSINGELLQLTGKLNPYVDGPLGVIKKDAYADILLIDAIPSRSWSCSQIQPTSS